MPARQVTRFRRIKSIGEDRPWRRQVQVKGGALLLSMAGLVLAGALYWAPRQWGEIRIGRAMQEFQDQHWNDMDGVERAWKSLPLLPPFEKGNEKAIESFLASQPLVVGIFDRFDQRRLWVRHDDHLMPAMDSDPQTVVYLNWIAHAEADQRFDWTPPKDLDPDFGKVASLVLLSDRWMVIKRWRPGDPSVERFLKLTLRPDASIRVGLVRESDLAPGVKLSYQDWGRDPHLQADPYRLASYAPLGVTLTTNAFGDGWRLGCISATADAQNEAADKILSEVSILRYIAFAIGIGALLGFWLRSRARQRAMLDADRLASMTHSLKTPLSILKFRCDTLRLGRLSQDQADVELMKLGAEVDHLTLMIENGLRSIRGDERTGPIRQIDSSWIRDVMEDLKPGFELEGRRLDLRLGPEQGRAAPASLRSALLTLGENALVHGSGTVTVETSTQGRRMVIRVLDEGPGLKSEELAVLGKPFQRIRKEGKEGFLHEGQGLGLSLLIQVAEREGWGLRFESAPGEGFGASLEIQRA